MCLPQIIFIIVKSWTIENLIREYLESKDIPNEKRCGSTVVDVVYNEIADLMKKRCIVRFYIANVKILPVKRRDSGHNNISLTKSSYPNEQK